MSADIIGAAYKGYYRDSSGLLVPEVANEAQRQRFYVIGQHVTDTAIQQDLMRIAPGARIDRGEAMVMIPGGVFRAAALEYAMLATQRESITIASSAPALNG